jgi:hypothetical protein
MDGTGSRLCPVAGIDNSVLNFWFVSYPQAYYQNGVSHILKLKIWQQHIE